MYIVPQKNPTTQYPEVRQVQNWLNTIRSCYNNCNWSMLKTDGYLGMITGEAIAKFQKQNKITPQQYGVLGDYTYNKIREKQVECSSKIYGSISATPNYSIVHKIRTNCSIKTVELNNSIQHILKDSALKDAFVSFLESCFDEAANFMKSKVGKNAINKTIKNVKPLQDVFKQLANIFNTHRLFNLIQQKTQKPKIEVQNIIRNLSYGQKQKLTKAVKNILKQTNVLSPNGIANKVSKIIAKTGNSVAKVGGKAMKWLDVGKSILNFICVVLSGEDDKVANAFYDIVDALILVAVGILVGIGITALGITVGWIAILVSVVAAIVVALIYDWLKDLCGQQPVSLTISDKVYSWVNSMEFQMLLSQK